MLAAPAHTIEHMRSRGLWGDTRLSDLFFRNARHHSDRTALVDAPNRRSFTDGVPKRLSYRELSDQTNRLSRLLLSIGLAKDDILVVQMPNIAELVVTYLAAWQIGIIVSPVAIQFREHELRHILNMASIGGLFLSWLQAAARLVLHHPLDLSVFLRQIAEEDVQHTVAPPALLNKILMDPELGTAVRFESLRTISSGSAPLRPDMVLGYARRFGVEIVNIFGSNEGMALISGPEDVQDPELRARIFPRFGRPDLAWKNRVSEHIETKLCDLETGEEILEPGRAGEMLIRGATVFSGYFRADELDREAFTKDGFFRTGDLFKIAGPGEELAFYRFVGRCKRLVIRGGLNISCEELETLIARHPKLLEAAVAGYPDEAMGERLCAVVVPRPGRSISLEEVCEHLKREGVAVYKFPERLRVLEQLPRNPMNKVPLPELRRIAAAAGPS